MKAQAYARADDTATDTYSKQKKTLEINPRHPLIKKLLELVKSDEIEQDDVKAKALDLSQYVLTLLLMSLRFSAFLLILPVSVLASL